MMRVRRDEIIHDPLGVVDERKEVRQREHPPWSERFRCYPTRPRSSYRARMPWCAKSEARIAALLRILDGCAARGGRIPAVVVDREATKHPAKIRAALRVGAAPAPRRVAGSLNRTSAIRLASALRVIRRRSQRCYTSLRLGALM